MHECKWIWLVPATALLSAPLAAKAQTPTPSPVPSHVAPPPASVSATPTTTNPAAKKAATQSTLINGTLSPIPLLFDLGNGRKLTVSGFIQGRYERTNADSSQFPEGGLGTANGYNGNYLAGTNGESFKIREARIAFTTTLSANTRVVAELGDPGAINSSTSGSAQVFVRRLFGQYTFGDGSAKFPTVTAGQFPNPFGYAINQPRAISYQPERFLAFNEGTSGLFSSQEQDRGVKLEYAPGKYSVSLAVVDGTGTLSNDINRAKDTILHAHYYITPAFRLGASGYFGSISTRVVTGTGATATTEINNGAKRELFGLDAQYTAPSGGVFAQTEYLSGKYEALPPFKLPNTVVTPAVTLSDFLPGNKVEGYYLLGGYTFAGRSAHPWSLMAGWDVLKREKSESSQTDENIGFGGTYNLDRGLRLRAYYITPNKVAHAAGVSDPKKRPLLILETQFLF